jgi:pantoate--beta-alanine ligase
MSNIQVITTPAAMSVWSEAARARGERIALVPTSGALHAGHVSLLAEARKRGDRLVLSIFENPTQFGPSEDLARHPPDLEGNLAKASSVGTDLAFVPEVTDMYDSGYQTFVDVRDVSRGLCAGHRAEHFTGVATIVCKLFNIVRPQVAIFGEKDFQQLAVVRRMVVDLNLPVEIIGHPIVRDHDGLALSSRNTFLSAPERAHALAISEGLSAARELFIGGERRASPLVEVALAVMKARVSRLDYVEVRDAGTLERVDHISHPAVILAAAFVGATRLVDNLRLG